MLCSPRARVRGWFPEVDFGRNAGPLYEALQPVRLASPESIRKQIAAPEPMTAAAQHALNEFASRLTAGGDGRFILDRNSSDLLLVLLLPKVAPYIVSTSGDAVSDGIARIRWFAARFQELSKVNSGETG